MFTTGSCQHCGAGFRYYFYGTKRWQERFCSWECRAAKKKKAKPQNIVVQRRKLPAGKCKRCKKEIEGVAFRRHGRKNKRLLFCSKESLYPQAKITPSSGNFYLTKEWRRVRYDALKRSQLKCVVCLRGKKEGLVLHVDHIKPRSKYPHLALDLNNLQVLCEDCNLGKGNRDEIDWRNSAT